MKRLLLLAGALAAGPALASAQSSEQIGAYLAISRTPVGALAPMLTNTLINRLQNGASLALRYGNLSSGDFNATNHAAAVTGILPAGLGASLRLTAGFNMTDCVDCDPDLLLGAGGDIRLVGSAMGNTATSPLWTVSLDGEIGYSNLNPGSAFSGYVGAPIGLVQRGQGMQFSPFITPGFAFAQTNGTLVSSSSGSGLMIGGGLGIFNSESSVVINVGGQHFFMSGARTTVGLNILFGGK